MAHRLKISELSVQYSATEPKALSALSLEVQAGSCCAIVGPTGAGKSTLLHGLAGILRKHHPESVASGRIEIGETVFEGLPTQILFPKVGLALQDPYVQISGVRDTVFDEVLFTLENLGIVPPDPRKTVSSLLRKFGIEHLADRKPTTLSGGETQRVALATILIAQPPLLLLDEPTTALDSNAQEKLGSILKSLRGRTTVLLTDAHVGFALGIADEFVVLNRGASTFHGDSRSLLSQLHRFAEILPVESYGKALSALGSIQTSSVHGQLISHIIGLQ